MRWSLREEWDLLQDLWEISGVTVPGGAGGEAVRLHTNIMDSLVMLCTKIHPFSCSHPNSALHPYTQLVVLSGSNGRNKGSPQLSEA